MTDVRVSSKWSDREEAIRTMLRRYRSIVANYEACQQWYDTLYPRTTAMLTDEPRGGANELHEGERIAQQRMELSDIMKKSLIEMRTMASDIYEMVKQLPPRESTVLVKRYIMGEGFEQIGNEMSYCIRRVYDIHDDAIRHMVELHTIA